MDELERMAFWKSVGIEALRAAGRHEGASSLESFVWKNEDDLFAFFDIFRPDGKGVEKVFAGIVGGDAILQRLLRVYQCTKESFQRFMYFIVCRPKRATPETLIELTKQHLTKVREIARSSGKDDLTAKLDPLPAIEIKYTREPPFPEKQPDLAAPETAIYGVVGDWFSDLVPVQSDALLLDEAFYSIACDYYIAQYLMWPLYSQSTDIIEPFAPYFELWTYGATPVYKKPGLATVFIPGDL